MRKSEGIKVMEDLAMRQKRILYPNVKEACLPVTKYSGKDTNSLTKAVIDCFKLHGFFATRIDSKGTYNVALKRFIPSNQKKGLPDVFAQAPCLPPIWVEVKCHVTRDTLKPHQKEVIEQLRNSGAIVYIATDFESFYQWFKKEIIKTEVFDTR